MRTRQDASLSRALVFVVNRLASRPPQPGIRTDIRSNILRGGVNVAKKKAAKKKAAAPKKAAKKKAAKKKK
jgi:hypothetical protein